MFEFKQLLEEADQLYVIFSHEEKGKLYIPFIGIDGRMEFFTSPQLAANAVKELKAKLKVNTYIKQISGIDNIKQFFIYLRENGLNMFRINNGSSKMQSLSLKDIIDIKETGLVDHLSKDVKNKFIRSKLYEKNIFELSDDEKKGALGNQFAELAYTMRFNGYRELYNGVFYILCADQKPAGGDYYTETALKKVREALKTKEITEKGFDESSLFHNDNTSARVNNKKPEPFYANLPGQAEKEKGFLCMFTDYALAQQGMNVFAEAGAKRGSVLAITMTEIMELSQSFAGVVLDMNTINYIIGKKDFDTIIKCGNYKEAIVVKLKNNQPEQ